MRVIGDGMLMCERVEDGERWRIAWVRRVWGIRGEITAPVTNGAEPAQ